MVLHVLVDLRIVEVSNVYVHLIGSTEELPCRRLSVGCQPNLEMVIVQFTPHHAVHGIIAMAPLDISPKQILYFFLVSSGLESKNAAQ